MNRAGGWLCTNGVEVASVYVHTGRSRHPCAGRQAQIPGRHGVDGEAGSGPGLRGPGTLPHREADIKNWKGNRGKAGFPSLSAPIWITGTASWAGPISSRRGIHLVGWRGKAFDNDAGWRIDCVLASPDLAGSCRSFTVGRAPSYSERWATTRLLLRTSSSDRSPADVRSACSADAAYPGTCE